MFNMKPVKENRKTVWVPDTCECGCARITHNEKGIAVCENCRKEAKKECQ
jgi:hypothetical protein